MVPSAIPAHVLAFLRERIDSVPELETLLLLASEGGRCWTLQELARRIYVREDRMGAILTTLQRRKLVAPAQNTADEFCFQPQDDAERRLVADVGETYRANLIAVATFIHDNAPASIREFARAFDFKKER